MEQGTDLWRKRELRAQSTHTAILLSAAAAILLAPSCIQNAFFQKENKELKGKRAFKLVPKL